MAQSKLYALLIGINEYDKIRKLGGCINDVDAVEKYLNSSTDFDLQIERLTDAKATRKGIAGSFISHLAKAKAGDTVLVYYSGHGTQEVADEMWGETDGALECLVCYDGGTTKKSEFLLTDKELRFLINRLYRQTKAHIVTIFDCCNSGDNTRNGALMMAGPADQEISERRVTDRGSKFFPKRDWADFLFSDTLTEAQVRTGKVAELLPQGVHIQMAACESNQTALEVSREGVFTKTLLKTLRDCGSNISYSALRSRIRQYMRASYEQTPRIYAPIYPDKLLVSGFMNRKIDPQKMICEAAQDKEGTWQINVGAIHGVKKDSAIVLSDPANPLKSIKATVHSGCIYVDHTIIDADGLVEGLTYKAQVAGLLSQELKLEVDNRDATPEEAEALISDMQKEASGGFSFGGEKGPKPGEKDKGAAEKADYTLHLNSGEAYLTMPGDPYRPLIRPVSFMDKNSRATIVQSLQHISRWHFIKNLKNEDVPDGFLENPLKIEISTVPKNSLGKPIEIKDGITALAYEKVARLWKGTIQVKITNTTSQSLYVCAAYLSKDFQCFLKFLPQRIQLLEAGQSVLLGVTDKKGVKKDVIDMSLGKVELEYNWPQTSEALKFIVSTTEFDAEALTLPALPAPLTTDNLKRGGNRGETKSLNVEEDENLEFAGWITQTVNLVFENPVYNKVPVDTVKALLEWEETAFFASGIYCEVLPDKTGQPVHWKLKGVVEPEDERGVLGDTKLWLGNQVETTVRRFRYFKLKQDKSRIRMVAEGDSWFQYPLLLKDVIDQLYKRYAIRSFAEAGDTLENYLKKKEYIAAIADEDAKYFLVSGGGNDVVGEEFPGFLREAKDFDPDDKSPKRYLNETFTAQLNKLDGLYTEMFQDLLTRFPDLHILVHCYDYVIPVDPATSNDMSWSGKHMVDKKIVPQLEREKLIVHILDGFAARLKALSEKPEFKGKVSFIDTRGLVKKGGWKDEIHPHDEGFELVAAKFIAEINRIEKLRQPAG